MVFKGTEFWGQAQFIKMKEAEGTVKLGTGFAIMIYLHLEPILWTDLCLNCSWLGLCMTCWELWL